MAINLDTTVVTTTPYTISVDDSVLLVNVPGPAIVKLPSGSGGNEKRSYIIKDVSGHSTTNPITITANGGRLIDGTAFAMLNGGYSHIQVISNGSTWFTI